MKEYKSKATGFTLIELLVVIAIIAMLMSILMAALSSVRAQARDVVCRHNLSQWGMILMCYIDDYGKYPRVVHFTDNEELVKRYGFEDIQYCPSDTRKEVAQAAGTSLAYNADSSYGSNLWLGERDEEDRQWLETNVRHTYRIPMFMDASYYDDKCDPTVYHYDNPPEYEGQPSGDPKDEMKRVCVNRHQEAINCAFLDFSARKVGLKELWELRWSRKWFTNKADFPDPYPPNPWPDWMKDFRDYSPYTQPK